ncbi:hypothetical protein KUF54_03120 [Comamonas sp. Y33R10-2]|uniref:hypothetical protein n=1 Tax=Comamonas sp. Y33R10-2 TaxID=2853257 RepID=UPI001C5C8C7E|nr:hypothetical protein [Comamonas sp. Y33R10-2]QXZ10264.1 hypothetical protein KUF54_03120 [Comamonas sp. Y33R10-2]
MSWNKQKNAMWAGALLIVGVLTFCIGAAVGASQTLKNFQDTFIPLMSMIGTWVAGIATAGAVWTALWLAETERRSDVESLKGMCNYTITSSGQTGRLAVRATADGKRPTRVKSLEFQSPKTQFLLAVSWFDSRSTKLPVTLSYGESATFILDSPAEVELLNFISEHCQGSAQGLKVVVCSTLREHDIALPHDLTTSLEQRASQCKRDWSAK